MRSMMMTAALVLSTVFAAAPAMAHGKSHDDKASFPMPAAAYKAKVDARQAKARARVEKRAAKLDAQAAKELRAKFDAGVAKVNAEVSKATADGTVTKDEAAAVRQVMKEVRGPRGEHAKRDQPKK